CAREELVSWYFDVW
nr:immunoglobulin heavy chain junction region [Mus musculus]